MSHLLHLLLALPLILPLAAEEGFRYGPRPNSHVFDPAETLTPHLHREISGPLQEILESENIDIFLVILPSLENSPPRHVARNFANAWCKPDIHALLLHVPGDENSPWIVMGGTLMQLLNREIIEATTVAAVRRARAEPTDLGKIRAVTTEASDALRHWRGGVMLRGEEILVERNQQLSEHAKKERFIKFGTILALTAIIPLSFVIAWLFLRYKASGPRYFPDARKQVRLGAPNAGGNYATTSIK